MGIIKELPENIANQIAAGEVIQRPASVVKELLENSIDAGASEITIVIKDSGRTLIQIIDNGKGMNTDDSIHCFKRHATSKIIDVKDLLTLSTKGFRGEALSSIAAISHVILKTKMNELDELGIETSLNGGQLVSQKEIVCNKGTSFEVKNLFFNVPARRNFLKSDAIELNHIKNEIDRIALAHCDIKIVFIHNNQELLHLNPCNLKKRIIDLFGISINESLIPIEENTNIVKIKGFISKPMNVKRTRGQQYFFVNNRFFKDSYYNHAVIKAFEKLIPDKTFPTYFIFFQVDPKKIDVNIHPTKTEIKFEEEKFIYSILNSSIRRSLGSHNAFSSLDFEKDTSFDLPSNYKNSEPVEPIIKTNPNYNPFDSQDERKTKSIGDWNNNNFGNSKENWKNLYAFENENEIIQSSIPIDSLIDTLTESQLIVFKKFIVVYFEEQVMFINYKRGLHRVIFDQILEKFQTQPIASQQLLFPENIELNSEEQTLIESNLNLLKRLGFEGEVQNKMLVLNGIPNVLNIDLFPEIFFEIIESLKYRDVQKEDIAYHLITKLSTIASLKFTINNQSEAISLVQDLFKCENHRTTSNGKKIIYSLSIHELTSKF